MYCVFQRVQWHGLCQLTDSWECRFNCSRWQVLNTSNRISCQSKVFSLVTLTGLFFVTVTGPFVCHWSFLLSQFLVICSVTVTGRFLLSINVLLHLMFLLREFLGWRNVINLQDCKKDLFFNNYDVCCYCHLILCTDYMT